MEKGKQSWSNQALNSDYTTKLSKPHSVLVQKQKYRPMNRNPRETNGLWSPMKMVTRIHNVGKTVSSIIGAGKTGQLHVKE